MNDGDGYENVTYKVASHADALRGSSCVTCAWEATYKVNMRCFKLYCAYSMSFSSKMLAKFSGVEFSKTVSKFKKKKKNVTLCSLSSQNMKLESFLL